MEVLSAEEWSLKSNGSHIDEYEYLLMYNYAKYLLEKQAEYINSQIRLDISVYSNEFIKQLNK